MHTVTQITILFTTTLKELKINYPIINSCSLSPAKTFHHIKHNNHNNDGETISGHLVQSIGKQP